MKNSHRTVRPNSSSLAKKETKKTSRHQHVMNELFIVDLQGDEMNLVYKQPNRRDMPRHFRTGRGRVLGTSTQLRIDVNASTDDSIVLQDRLASPTLNGLRRSASLLHGKEVLTPALLIPSRGESSTTSFEQDFIPVSVRKRRLSISSSISDDGLRRLDAPMADDSEVHSTGHNEQSECSSDLEDTGFQSEEDIDQSIKERNSELLRRTEEFPHSEDAWNKLIEHQAAMLSLGHRSRGKDDLQRDRRALASVRSFIFKQAIKNIPAKNAANLRLRLSYMQELAHINEERELAKKWRALAHDYPHCVEAWIGLLDLMQASFASFRYEDCRRAYLECLISLGKIESRTETDANAALHVFVRLTSMMRQAGYQEHATGLWQALLEHQFFRPVSIDQLSEADLQKSFESFWESEVPRIGELGARGWKQWHADTSDTTARSRERSPNEMPNYPQSEEFYAQEQQLSNLFKHPGRLSDDEASEDPYHVVLYHDIEVALSCIPPRTSPDAIVQAYLFYQGLPAFADYGDSHSLQISLSNDPYLHVFVHPRRKETERNEMRSGHVSCFVQTCDTLFKYSFESRQVQEDIDWLERSLGSILRAMAESDAIAEYYIFFVASFATELKLAPDSISKRILKSRPYSLRLYNAYAMVVSKRSAGTSAASVFGSAIGMSETLPRVVQNDAILLWRNWIWERLTQNGVASALELISSIGNPQPYESNLPGATGSDKECRRASFIAAASQALKEARYRHAVLACECSALHDYLSNLGRLDLEAALETYSSFDATLKGTNPSVTVAREQLHQARCHLLVFHIQNSSLYRPAVVRDTLLHSIEQFPHNTIFLSSFRKLESRFPIEERIRTAVLDVIRNDSSLNIKESIISITNQLDAEVEKFVNGNVSLHSIRAKLERASKSTTGANCPLVWHRYLTFEFENCGDQIDRVRDVLHRGMLQMPWNKWFIMRFFDVAQKILDKDECSNILRIMEEKELRVFVASAIRC